VSTQDPWTPDEQSPPAGMPGGQTPPAPDPYAGSAQQQAAEPPGSSGPPGSYAQADPYGQAGAYGQPGAYGQATGVGQAAPYGQATGYAAAPLRTDDKAVWALVTSIAGFVLCPILLHIIGWVLANQSLATIRASGGTIGGDGIAKAARILSIVGLVLYGVIGLFAALFLVIGLIAAVSNGELTQSGAFNA